MEKKSKLVVDFALKYVSEFLDTQKNTFVYHDIKYVNNCIEFSKEIARAEGVHKKCYELGTVALILFPFGNVERGKNNGDHSPFVERFFQQYELPEKQKQSIRYYLEFLRNNKTPKNVTEMVLWDCKDVDLGMPEALERLNLMRSELEIVSKKKLNDLEWELFCKQYFINHTFFTRYALRKFGSEKSKNFIEIEKRIMRLQEEIEKGKRKAESEESPVLSSKESEDLFKIAFRNYLNLIGLADKKAHLLIQINSILASVIIALTVKRGDYPLLVVIPGSFILAVAGLTMFYAILASRPLKKFTDFTNTKRQFFFFGSFDRLDPDFKFVSWEKYNSDINALFFSDKKVVFSDLVKESFLVRKVLSRKFGFLSIAYNIFVIGLILGILSFLVLLIFNFNR